MAKPGRRSAIYGDQASATTIDGRGLPVTIDSVVGLADRAGVEPTKLDNAIAGLIAMCEDGAELLQEAGPLVRGLVEQMKKEAEKTVHRIEMLSAAQDAKTEDEQMKIVPGITDMLARSLDVTNKITIVLDRVNKMLLNAVKAKDVAIRLRTFIATGDEAAHGLEDMGENALRRLVNLTANGEMVPAAERG